MKQQKALLIIALMIMAFAGYYWYATSPGRCGWDRTWTGLPCPRSAPPDGFCSIHEPIVKARIAELQRILKERSK